MQDDRSTSVRRVQAALHRLRTRLCASRWHAPLLSNELRLCTGLEHLISRALARVRLGVLFPYSFALLLRPLTRRTGLRAPENNLTPMTFGSVSDSSIFHRWTRARRVPVLTTNAGTHELPFQHWRRFKEAFTPELVAHAIADSPIKVRRCIDPFGGSGTTALTCQFLGIHPITAEVNPYLADLIESKLSQYDRYELQKDLFRVTSAAESRVGRPHRRFKNAPATFVEPGVEGRWVFDMRVAERIDALLGAIERLRSVSSRRLFRVIAGGILVRFSNVLTSGKGRRYRARWKESPRDPSIVVRSFLGRAQRVIAEVSLHSRRPCRTYDLIRGDARSDLAGCHGELVVTSPPYPNSFDYTDVYNLELWTLGYLRGKASNVRLRQATLSSHVQLYRDFGSPPDGSARLRKLIRALQMQRHALWNPWIPEMIGAYFQDLCSVLDSLFEAMSRKATVWIVVGDSQYASVTVRTSSILAELARARTWSVRRETAVRNMRSSAQQGGSRRLAENLLVLQRR